MSQFASRLSDKLLLVFYFINLGAYLLVNVFKENLPDIGLLFLLIHAVLLIMLVQRTNALQADKDERLIIDSLQAHARSWRILASIVVVGGFLIQLVLNDNMTLPPWDSETVVAVLFVLGMVAIALPYLMLKLYSPPPLLEE